MTTWSIPDVSTGTERRLLESTLDRNRAELVNTVRGLSEEDARRRLVASMTTPIGLVKHAAVAEREKLAFLRVTGAPTASRESAFLIVMSSFGWS